MDHNLINYSEATVKICDFVRTALACSSKLPNLLHLSHACLGCGIFSHTHATGDGVLICLFFVPLQSSSCGSCFGMAPHLHCWENAILARLAALCVWYPAETASMPHVPPDVGVIFCWSVGVRNEQLAPSCGILNPVPDCKSGRWKSRLNLVLSVGTSRSFQKLLLT